jgi:hypothetical protein
MSDIHDSVTTAGGEQYRHYPPGVVFHAPHCVDGGDAMSLPVTGAFEVYPNHQFHTCFTPIIPVHLADNPEKLVGLMPCVMVEKVNYHQHPYSPYPPGHPAPQPQDPIHPLCRICRGTHQGQA